ncbi:MAG: hypothetical protein WAM42_10530 [Candidatus Nitrosopolaris sp.]|jgi:hypothetical protein
MNVNTIRVHPEIADCLSRLQEEQPNHIQDYCIYHQTIIPPLEGWMDKAVNSGFIIPVLSPDLPIESFDLIKQLRNFHFLISVGIFIFDHVFHTVPKKTECHLAFLIVV